jgi:hypothetical protein
LLYLILIDKWIWAGLVEHNIGRPLRSYLNERVLSEVVQFEEGLVEMSDGILFEIENIVSVLV